MKGVRDVSRERQTYVWVNGDVAYRGRVVGLVCVGAFLARRPWRARKADRERTSRGEAASTANQF